MNLSRYFFKAPQLILPSFSFQDIHNSEKRARLNQCQFNVDQNHPFDLILMFIAALIEGNIVLANQRLTELSAFRAEDIKRIFHEFDVESGCVAILTQFPVSSNFSGRVIWGLLNQFLQEYSASYHQTLFNPIRPEVTKKLHQFEYAKEINPNVQVDCFVRKKWRWQDPGSRDHEMGPRITKGFEYGGWKSRYFDIGLGFLEGASSGLTKDRPRICIFDIEFAFLNLEQDLEPCLEIMQKNYDVKIAVLFDAWQPQTKAMMAKMMPYFDFIWCPMPTSMDLLEPVHQGRSIIFPFPQGVHPQEIQRIRNERQYNGGISFSGGVGLANPSRLNWLAAISPHGVADIHLSTHNQSLLDPIQDYTRYLERLTRSEASLSFSVRYNGMGVATGRSFEVPLTGGLLLQEFANDMRVYFEPGEHFIEFFGLSHLTDVLGGLAEKSGEQSKIALQGSEFLDMKYSIWKVSRALLSIILKLLY